MSILGFRVGLMAETIYDLYYKQPPAITDEFTREALRCQLIEHILTLLDQSLVDVEQANSCKAHLVDSCKLMSQSLVYGEQVQKILLASSVWINFKDLQHALFIETSTHMKMLTAGPSGPAVAGYLTSSGTTNAGNKQNATEPPPLTPLPSKLDN